MGYGNAADQVSDHGAAVADLGGADLLAGLDERPAVGAAERGGEDVGVGRQRAELELAVGLARVAKLGQAGQVDQRLGRADAATQLDDQVGAPGDQTRAGAVLGREAPQLGPAGRPEVALPHR